MDLDFSPLENPLEKVTAYFLEEAQEHLDILEAGIANLPTTTLDYQQLADLYRSTFALRGGLGMLGYSSPIAASSGLDACLQHLTQSPVPVDVGIITAFLELVQILRQTVQLAANKSAIAGEEFATLQFQSRWAIDNLKAQLNQLHDPTLNENIHQP